MIYADNAATTRLSKCAFEEMIPYLSDQYGNASSQYSFGMQAKRAIERARQQVAAAIMAAPSEVVFTSGGSEANSWVLRGIAELYRGESIHIIVSAIEHHSVLRACKGLEAAGVETSFLPADCNGRVVVSDLEAAIRPNTRLVSIMLANNEIGTLQPVAEIRETLRKRRILFHTDAVQAVGHIPVDVNALRVDFLSASAHKFNGAKGTGFLYIREGISLLPLISGGKQESGLRGGTENVAGIVAMGCAAEESCSAMRARTAHLLALREATIGGLRVQLPGVQIYGDPNYCLPGIISVGFSECISGEAMLHQLDMKGICVSSGSACDSGTDVSSHVLIAIGQPPARAKAVLRISYDHFNSLADAQTIVNKIVSIHAKIVNR